MFILKEYYLYKDKVMSHPLQCFHTFREAYNFLMEIHNGNEFAAVPSIPDKIKTDFLGRTLRKENLKDKSIITIEEYDHEN